MPRFCSTSVHDVYEVSEFSITFLRLWQILFKTLILRFSDSWGHDDKASNIFCSTSVHDIYFASPGISFGGRGISANIHCSLTTDIKAQK